MLDLDLKWSHNFKLQFAQRALVLCNPLLSTDLYNMFPKSQNLLNITLIAELEFQRQFVSKAHGVCMIWEVLSKIISTSIY